MRQVKKVQMSCYLVLIAKPSNKTAASSWPDPYGKVWGIMRYADWQIDL